MPVCELFALSSRLPATVDVSLEAFSRHGGLTGPHKDGWGIAYYEGLDVRLIKDTTAAAQSPWVGFLERQRPCSDIVISHIRRSTAGTRRLRNTQPFVRELGGRMHVFAHNGHLEGIRNWPGLAPGFHRPVGETDSEAAMCALLGRLEPLWLAAGEPPGLLARLETVRAFAAELRKLGPANFLYADGELLIAHGHRRMQADGGIAPPGLWLLERRCPPGGDPFHAGGMTVSSEHRPAGDEQDQKVALVASVPLTGESWRPLDEGASWPWRAGASCPGTATAAGLSGHARPDVT